MRRRAKEADMKSEFSVAPADGGSGVGGLVFVEHYCDERNINITIGLVSRTREKEERQTLWCSLASSRTKQLSKVV